MAGRLFAAASLSVLLLAGCGNPRAEAAFEGQDRFEELPISQQKQLIDQYARNRGNVALPTVSSRSELAGLVDVFAQACIDGKADKARFQSVAAANGFRPSANTELNIRIGGYTKEKSFFGPTDQEITDYAMEKLKDDRGRYPVFDTKIGFKPSGSNAANLSNGRATLAWNKATNTTCTLTVKLPSDDAALAELQRVVNQRGIASGAPANTGLFGTGYILDSKTFITLGRQGMTAPTALTVLKMK